MTYQSCILILADGARADVMQDLLQRGALPNIAEHLHFRPAVSVFPSTTGPAYLPFLTGNYPGTCNVPGIRWFDKGEYAQGRFSLRKFRSYVGPASCYINSDLDPNVTSLFQRVQPSINIFSSISRGVSGNNTKFSRIWYWYYAHLTDHWGLIDEAARERILKCLDKEFRFLFAVFPGIDEFSHLHSPFGKRTLEAYAQLDRAVGDIVKKLKRLGRWEETCLMIVSDHGLSETRQHLGLNRFLETEMKLPTLFYPLTVFKTRFAAASMVSGNGMSHLYLGSALNGCNPRRVDWQKRSPWEILVTRPDRLIDRLLEQEAVDLVAGQYSDGSIGVKSRRGEATIKNSHDSFEIGSEVLQYKIIGSDPFAYGVLPEKMTGREALEKTFGTNYPDALMQLVQIFRSPRTGDLVVSARRGFDLRQRYEHPEHKSSHGSLDREHMMIPCVTNAPLSKQPIRSVDVFPTILQLLGEPVPAGIDGEGILLDT